MINSLLINRKYKYIIGYIIIITISILYIYNEYTNLNDMLKNETKKEMIRYYNFYKKVYTSSAKQKNILIKNIDYSAKNDLKDEFSKSTPLMMQKEESKNYKYNLTFKFFENTSSNKKYLETKLLQLKDKEYIQYFENNAIHLFGTISTDGYILIVKQYEQIKETNLIVEALFIKFLFLCFLNIILLLYLIHLIKAQEITKEQLYQEFEQLQIDTKKLAFQDTLTGAATRLKFDETLKDLINIALRFKEQKFTAIMIDIDNFKKVNDTYGHDYGDLVLQSVAKVIKNHIRKTDTFARWGGEEFVILSPMNHLKDSFTFANKIRELIANINFEKLDHITCSFGLTEFRQKDTEQSIMKRVDELLYKAKQNGKNRVEYI